jgi:bacteriorhodopsin
MKRAQFVAAVLCAVVCAVQAVLSISEGRWLLFAVWAVFMVVCFVMAWALAMRKMLQGKTPTPMGKA